MRRFDTNVPTNKGHRREGYAGPLISTGNNGRSANVNNLYNSQVRDAQMMMPFGISSRPYSGVRAQAIINSNNDSSVVGVYDKNRPDVEVGEICIYSDGENMVYLKKDGSISISTHKSDIECRKNGDISFRTDGDIIMDCNSLIVNNKTIYTRVQ